MSKHYVQEILYAPIRCPHCGHVVYGKNKKYRKIVEFVQQNGYVNLRPTRAGEISTKFDILPNMYPKMLRRLIELNLIKRTKRGYYEPA